MFQAILLLIASIGIMLIGVKLLSEGLQKLINDKVKKFVNKFAKNRVRTSATGLCLTFAMQSSTASTIMCVGLTSVGILSLIQGMAFIAGCNIGSSLTLLLLSFNSLSVKEIFAVTCFIGIILTFFNNDKVKLIGKALMGFGLIFSGLCFISSNISIINSNFDLSVVFSKINNPLLMFLFGILLTIILQSSFGTVALIVTLIASGAISSVANIYSLSFFVYGINIGTTLTTLIVSLTSNNEGKKIAIYHLLFNIVGVIIFVPLSLCHLTKILELITPNLTFQIILQDIVFNTFTAVVMLMLLKPFEKLLNKMIKQKLAKGEEIWYINDSALNNPILALKELNNKSLLLIQQVSSLHLKIEQNLYSMDNRKKLIKQINALETGCDIINKSILKASNETNNIEKLDLLYVQFLIKTVKKITNIYKKAVDANIIEGERIELYQYQKDVVKKIVANQNLIFENLLNMTENFCLDNKEFDYQSATIKIFQLVTENSEVKNKQKLNYVSNLATSNNTEKKHYIYFNTLNLLQDMTNYLSDISVELFDVVIKSFEIKGEKYDNEFNTITSK